MYFFIILFEFNMFPLINEKKNVYSVNTSSSADLIVRKVITFSFFALVNFRVSRLLACIYHKYTMHVRPYV